MIKLRELIDEKKYVDNAYNRSKDRVGADWGADKGDGKKKDKKSKEDKPKTPGLGGGWDKHDGPEDKDDAVGKGEDANPQKESAIVRGIRAMATTNSERDRDDQETAVDIEGEDGPTTNLCDVEVPGTNMFCGDNKDIPRAEMPQLKSKPWKKGEGPDPNNPDAPEWVWDEKKGEWKPNTFEETDEEYAERVPAAAVLKKQNKQKYEDWKKKNPDKPRIEFLEDPGLDEEANTEDLFKANLEKLDPPIKMAEEQPRNVADLKATQNELKPANVAFMVDVLMTATPPPHNTGDPDKDKEELDKWKLSESLREPIIVSKDGYILDGHHRWAALVALDIANGGSGDIEIGVKEVEADADELVEKTKEFTRDQGLQTKPAEKKKEESIQPFAELYYRMKK